MSMLKNVLLLFTGVSLFVIGFPGAAAAQTRNQKQVRDAIRSLRAQVDDFQYALNFELANNSPNVKKGEINSGLRQLEDSIETFDGNFIDKRENRDDVNAIIDAARVVDGVMRSTQFNRRLQTDWSEVKRSVEELAGNYSIVADWNGSPSASPRSAVSTRPIPVNNDQTTATTTGYSSDPDSPLTGTYRLDTTRSENISDIVSTTGANGADRTDLESKLEAPDQIALLVRGNVVTLATSNASPVTVTADGVEKTEQANGRTMRLRATLRGDELQVSSLGGESDYTIIFRSFDGGQSLKVTRRITTPYLKETVFAESVYARSDNVAGLGIDPGMSAPNGGYSSTDPNDVGTSTDPNRGRGNQNDPVMGPPRTGHFIVPNGTVLTADLQSLIDSEVSQNNDRFKLTVQSPMEFRGAVIEGYITGVGRSGRVSGRSNITFNFDSITLRTGERYDFAGSLQSIKDESGKTVKVDTEGTAKGDSQTKETAKRGGIGAGIGAIIGAIAGGGKGAVLGAIIGGGAGAGSVIATGRDDVKLGAGSTLTIQSSSPIRSTDDVSENN